MLSTRVGLMRRLCRQFATYYSKEHEWISIADGNIGTLGITNHAQDQLGEIVHVELPEVDSNFKVGESMGTIESVKSVADLYSPVTGKILEVNTKLADAPELVNSSPEKNGWMVKIQLLNSAELESLLDLKAYKKFCEN